MKKIGMQGGYIALMATIIISAILLVMAVEEGSLGWYSRFTILGTEAKEQANALAEGCADQALAAIVTDPTYGGATTTVTTSGGTCIVDPVRFNYPVTGDVTINTQADVRNSYANLSIAMNMSALHLGTPAPGKGTLVVVTQVINDGNPSPGLAASAFTMHVTGTNPSQTAFGGADTGVVVTMDAGAYSVTEGADTRYKTTYSTTCTGSISNGQVKFCTVTNDDITTTLTLIANVKNDNAGTNAPADFPMFIDGAPATLGQVYSVTGGTAHTVRATLLSGYAASSWGYNCSGSVNAGTVTVPTGQSMTCVINFDDIAPPSPSCADTVMILDRTGSMASADLANEKSAALALNTLYAGVLPPASPPHIGVGSIGAYPNASLPAGAASVYGLLTTTYTTITSAINSIAGSNSSVGSDLSAGITAANNELNSARHVAGNAKVLVLVSDGDPNQPSGSTSYNTGFASTTANAQNASGDVWTNPTNAYSSGGGDASATVSAGSRHRYYNFGFGSGAGLPAGASVAGIEVQASTWATASLSTVNTGNLAPSSLGPSVEWDPNTGSAISAVTTNDAGAYIVPGPQQETFGFANAGVPAGATINSVTVHAVALGSGNTIQLMEENSGGTQVFEPTTHALTASYTDYSYTFPTMPNGSAWTLSEVNAWTSKFGVQNVSGTTARVTQMYVVVGYTAPGATACQLGVDLSWNAGTTWTTEKTQTLTGTQATYTLGATNDDWSSTHTWVPTDFSDANFRARVHAIDPGSNCDNTAVDHLDYLQTRVSYTVTVDPIAAALTAADVAKKGPDGIAGTPDDTDIFTIHFGGDPGPYAGTKLLANLASGSTTVTYNGVTYQDGAYADPGGVTTGDTGYVAPTAVTTPNQWTNPTRAYVSDNSYATDAVSGHQQGYTTFGFNIPPTATVSGIALSVEAKSSDSSGCQVGAELSSNNGTSFTTTGTNAGVSGSDVAYTLGGSGSLWGRSWAPSDLNNGNFVVRLQDIDPGNACLNGSTLSVDQIRARVYYSVNTENSDGDNYFVAPTSADMQSIFNFIGNQVCPAANVIAVPPPTTGTLLVLTTVANNNGGSATPSSFTANVSASSPSQTSFAGSSSGVLVTMNPGAYSITETAVSGYNELSGATCNSTSAGNIAAGETRVCILSNADIPPPPPPPNFNINVGNWQEVP